MFSSWLDNLRREIGQFAYTSSAESLAPVNRAAEAHGSLSSMAFPPPPAPPSVMSSAPPPTYRV